MDGIQDMTIREITASVWNLGSYMVASARDMACVVCEATVYIITENSSAVQSWYNGEYTNKTPPSSENDVELRDVDKWQTN